jgi:hypothetical protein
MEEMMKTYFQENLKIGDYLRDLSIDGRLKWKSIMDKYVLKM